MTGDAVWVGSPASYTKGRARPVQYVTLHYTAGSEGPTSAENGATYDKNRTDGTSTHYFTDSSGPPLQEVSDGDRSHAARWHGNEIGIHIEICGTKQTRAQWLDPTSLATLKTTAKLVSDLCDKHGLPKKRLTVAQTRAAYYNASGSRPKGINDHGTVTQAYPEDQGDHMDVGSDFPWDVFMDMVVTGGNDVGQVEGFTKDGFKDMMKTDDAIPNLPWRSDYRPLGDDAPPTGPTGGTNQYIMWETWFAEMGQETMRQRNTLAEIKAMLAGGVEISPVVKVDPESVAAIADATADEIRNDPERDGV